MNTDRAPFVRGNDRLDALLADPDRRAAAMSLATIRQAAHLTHVELAHHMDANQSSISQLESRDSLLLTTLTNYLTAAGATEVSITARIADRDITWTPP